MRFQNEIPRTSCVRSLAILLPARILIIVFVAKSLVLVVFFVIVPFHPLSSPTGRRLEVSNHGNVRLKRGERSAFVRLAI